MSLNDITLHPFTIKDLYKNTLVEDTPKPGTVKHSTDVLTVLGNNKKRITLIVQSKDAIHLPDEALNFLLGILSACKLTMEDVAILNIEKNSHVTYQLIASELKAETILLFGVDVSQIGLPIQFPHYQVQHYNNQVYLCAPVLPVLQNDKAEKISLWNSLKKVFSIL